MSRLIGQRQLERPPGILHPTGARTTDSTSKVSAIPHPCAETLSHARQLPIYRMTMLPELMNGRSLPCNAMDSVSPTWFAPASAIGITISLVVLAVWLIARTRYAQAGRIEKEMLR
jgi:hypothetical protein